MADPAPRPDEADATLIQRVRTMLGAYSGGDGLTVSFADPSDLLALCALAERATWSEDHNPFVHTHEPCQGCWDVVWLRDKTKEQLVLANARVAALEGALKTFAEYDNDPSGNGKWRACRHCGAASDVPRNFRHASDCPILVARAALTPRGDADRAGE